MDILARMGVLPNQIYPFLAILGAGLDGPSLCIPSAFSFIEQRVRIRAAGILLPNLTSIGILFFRTYPPNAL